MPNPEHNGVDLRSLTEAQAVIERLPNVKIYLLMGPATARSKRFAEHVEALVGALRVYHAFDPAVAKAIREHYATEQQTIPASTAGIMFSKDGSSFIRLTKAASEDLHKVSQAYLDA